MQRLSAAVSAIGLVAALLVLACQNQDPQYPARPYTPQTYPPYQPQQPYPQSPQQPYPPSQQYPQQPAPQPTAQPQPPPGTAPTAQSPAPFQLPQLPPWLTAALPLPYPGPSPTPAPAPTGTPAPPGAGNLGCPVSQPQTYSAHLHVTDPAGPLGYCKDYDADLTIASTGAATARVNAKTSDVNETDEGASLDSAACKVWHGAPGYQKQIALVQATITYELYPKPDGSLSGQASVRVGGFGVQNCERQYSVTGVRK